MSSRGLVLKRREEMLRREGVSSGGDEKSMAEKKDKRENSGRML